jgi:hypothetical protein
MKLMLSASLVVLLSACSERIEVPAKPADPPVPLKVTIQGEDPSSFYAKLGFVAEGECKKSVVYQYLAASRIPVEIDQRNQNVFANLELMLFGAMYVARFVEYIPRKHAFEKTTLIRERVFEGAYMVKEGMLVISGLGSGFGVMQFGTRALLLSIDENSMSLSKKVLALRKVYSNDPPMERFRICK